MRVGSPHCESHASDKGSFERLPTVVYSGAWRAMLAKKSLGAASDSGSLRRALPCFFCLLDFVKRAARPEYSDLYGRSALRILDPRVANKMILAI